MNFTHANLGAGNTNGKYGGEKGIHLFILFGSNPIGKNDESYGECGGTSENPLPPTRKCPSRLGFPGARGMRFMFKEWLRDLD